MTECEVFDLLQKTIMDAEMNPGLPRGPGEEHNIKDTSIETVQPLMTG
jgi:hypothetical protein